MLPWRKRVEIGSDAGLFAERRATASQRAAFTLLDGLLAAVGFVLRLGGRPLQWILCQTIGTILYAAFPGRRRVARINLDLAFGGTRSAREKRRITRAMFVHFVRLGMDFLWDDVYWPLDALPSRVSYEGHDVLVEALKEGRGCLGATGHLGNWELLGAATVALGIPMAVVFRAPHGAYADHLIARKRRRFGFHLVEMPPPHASRARADAPSTSRPSIEPKMAEQWNEGRLIAYLCDQYPGSRALRVPFLGVPDTPTPVGALRYALKRGLPLVIAYGVYEGWNRAKIVVMGPIHPDPEIGDLEARVAHYAGVINAWWGERVREYPEQWTWGHRRFAREHYRRGP